MKTATLRGVREYGGNGTLGFCILCEELVPAIPRQDGEGYRCGNHVPGRSPRETPTVVTKSRASGARAWTRTKKHMLHLLPNEEAFCRACQAVVRVRRRGVRRPLCAGPYE